METSTRCTGELPGSRKESFSRVRVNGAARQNPGPTGAQIFVKLCDLLEHQQPPYTTQSDRQQRQ